MNRLVMMIFLAVYSVLPAPAQRARVDFDHACDFSHYQTYRWAGPPDLGTFNQLMQERVVGFVDEALSARRLKRVDAGGDLLVSCRMDVHQQEVFTTFNDGFGFGWDAGWGSSISTTTMQAWLMGTLTVDLVDARQKRLVFEGVSTASISSKPDRNTKRYAKVVNKIFDKYPPR